MKIAYLVWGGSDDGERNDEYRFSVIVRTRKSIVDNNKLLLSSDYALNSR